MGPVPDIELPAKVDWTSFICVYTAFAVAVLLWVWPVWRHLNQLGQAADAFGNGNFNARANVPSISAIASLAKTFNSMADRIQRLIASHKELTNAVSHELRTPISRLRFGIDMVQTVREDSLRQQYLSGMNDDIDELESLVREMLTYSRFDRDTPDMKPEQQQIYSWLKHIVAEKQKMSDSVRLVCRINSPENLYAEYEPRLMAGQLITYWSMPCVMLVKK
ncbi:MAG: HAMP domain-containing protein [Desulfobacteraceae bacterium]|nr:HAMP domain-containing protein [Desulfobacteraceae bacterium]